MIRSTQCHSCTALVRYDEQQATCDECGETGCVTCANLEPCDAETTHIAKCPACVRADEQAAQATAERDRREHALYAQWLADDHYAAAKADGEAQP